MCPAQSLEYGLGEAQPQCRSRPDFTTGWAKRRRVYRRRFFPRVACLLTARQRLAGDGMVAVQASVSKRAARSNVIGAREYS